jgi:hypothetical protein
MAGAQQNGVNGKSNGANGSYASRYDLADHFFGGNSLSVAAPGDVKDFVARNDGHTVITSVSRPDLPPLSLRAVCTSRQLTWPGSTGAHREQRYCGSQGDPLGAEMGIRDVWR